MNLVDMFRLRKVQIEDGYIVYQRSKTDKLLQIRVTPELQEIIDKYDDPDSSFVLPFLGGSEKTESFLTYRNALMRINRNLKIIGRQLGLSYPLTTYVIRHSWASLALESGVSTDVIRQGMGHSSLRTTEIYLSGFDRSTVDTANEKLLQWVSGDGKESNKKKVLPAS